MTQPQITIIGLGLIGGSIGLALKASGRPIDVMGHDAESGRNRLAQKVGAVDKTNLNLINASKDADLVVIATPINTIREILEVIGPHLKPGSVVTDTATLKEPVLTWAAEMLPESVAFVGGDPVLSPAAQAYEVAQRRANAVNGQGLEAARADLFKDALYAICPPPTVAPTAVKRVSDMVALLGAEPFFVDPAEHDGMRAAVEGLPAVTGLALMRHVSGSPGWREARKVADHVLSMSTASLTGAGAPQRAQLLLNANYLLPRIDALIAELRQLRQWVADKDADALEKAFDDAIEVRDRWLIDHLKGDWEEEINGTRMPGLVDSLGDLFGLGGRPRRDKDES